MKYVRIKQCAIGNGSFTGHFNMAVYNAKTPCGTVCCIAGTADLLMGRAAFEISTPGLNKLCYPKVLKNWEAITLAQAAIALRNYLTLPFRFDSSWPFNASASPLSQLGKREIVIAPGLIYRMKAPNA